MAKQFFSNNYDINYNDYLKFKRGNENIKKLISDKKYNVNTFINYETFLILTKSFYKQINNRYDVSPPRSISNADTSYKSYKLFNAHITNCSYCCNCKVISNIFNCKEVQNILYPYGKAIIKRDDLDHMYFPHSLKLNNYCCHKCKETPSCKEEECNPPPKQTCSCLQNKPVNNCHLPRSAVHSNHIPITTQNYSTISRCSSCSSKPNQYHRTTTTIPHIVANSKPSGCGCKNK